MLNPSEECRVALVNLICLQTFELCDKDDAIHLVNGETCTNIRDNICPAEWALGTQFPDFFSLPVCEDLPSGSNNCMGMLMGTLGALCHCKVVASGQAGQVLA